MTQQSAPLATGLSRVLTWCETLGTRIIQLPYWIFVAGTLAIVLVKTGFRWAGTTGEGWFIEFNEAIVHWPLKEPLSSPIWVFWQENYSSILLFRGLRLLGLPDSSFTWQLLHWTATGLAIYLLIRWSRTLYSDDWGRLVLLLVLFGAAPMVLLHEVGRYDSLFFLGAIMAATSRRWWWVTIGLVLLATSNWPMGLAFAAGMFLTGLVIGSRTLIVRSIATVGACITAVLFLMGARIVAGGDPSVARLGGFMPGGIDNADQLVPDPIPVAWNNIVTPFPNWIWAMFGVTWLLLLIVVFQFGRRKTLLALAIIALPTLAGLVGAASDGTRDKALSVTAVLLAAATALELRSRRSEDERRPLNPAIIGVVAVACILLPVVNIQPIAPFNPWQWLGDYGLSIVESVRN